MPKGHQINSLKDLCNLVNEDNVFAPAEDIKLWLISYHNMIEMYRNKFPKQTKGKCNTDIAEGGFEWVNDGENKVLGATIETDNKTIKIEF